MRFRGSTAAKSVQLGTWRTPETLYALKGHPLDERLSMGRSVLQIGVRMGRPTNACALPVVPPT